MADGISIEDVTEADSEIDILVTMFARYDYHIEFELTRVLAYEVRSRMGNGLGLGLAFCTIE